MKLFYDVSYVFQKYAALAMLQKGDKEAEEVAKDVNFAAKYYAGVYEVKIDVAELNTGSIFSGLPHEDWKFCQNILKHIEN